MRIITLLISILSTISAAQAAKDVPMSAKKALIVVTSHSEKGSTGEKTGWYLSEVSHVYFPLVAAGFTVDFASPNGGAAPLDESSRDLKDAENKRFVEDPHLMARMRETARVADVDPRTYKVVHFAGGHGTMWDFAQTPAVGALAAGVYDNGGVVSAVCHGPAALVNARLANGKYLVEGKDLTVFSDAEEAAVGLTKVVPFLLESTLRDRGARTHAAGLWQEKVSVSERLVTGQNPASARLVGKRLVELAK